ncbi:MAG: phage tail tape measure protein [Patescibacteria group bacterium]|nr:phage tail tape measure protein [Patescibacteria group bacterium]
MESTKNLQVVFTGETAGLTAAFGEVQGQASATKGKLESLSSSLKNIGSDAEAIGRKMTTSITLPIVGIAVASAKMASDFQQQMTYVRTDAGDTTDNIDELSKSVLNLAKVSQYGPDELAKGLYHIASLGLRGADALNALNTAQQMAAVGGANLEETTSALGAALVTGIRGVQDYSSAAGTLDAIIGSGNMRMNDLIGALSTGALVVFKNAGLSLTDFGAALATLTDNGMRADEASTRLKMSISLMEAPSMAAADAMRAIGFASTDLGLEMRQKGLIPALQDLQKHLTDTYGVTDLGKTKITQAVSAMFGGGRSSAAIQTLLDQVDRVQSKFTQISEQSGEFASKVAEQAQTSSAKIKTAWSGIQSSAITLGGDLLPTLARAFESLSKGITSLVAWFDKLSPSTKKFVEIISVVAAAAGPLLLVLGTLASALAVLATPLGIAVVAFTAIGGTLLYMQLHFKTVTLAIAAVRREFDHLWGIVSHTEPFIILMQFIHQVFIPGLKAIWAALEQNVVPALEKMAASLGRLWNALEPGLTAALKVVGAILGGLLLAAIWAAVTAINLIVQAFAMFISAVTNVINWISNLISWFGNLVMVVVNSVHAVIAIFSNLTPAVKDVIGTVVGLFGALGSMILGAVGNFGSLLYNAGRSLIHGLVAGIESSIGSVTSAVGHIATSAGNAVSGALHSAHIPGFAMGTGYAPGGLAMVGENGPELVNLPRGAQVMNNEDTMKTVNNRSVTIGTIVLASAGAVQEMFKQLDRDNILVGKGLSPARGM